MPGKPRVVAIIIARLTSSRLPRKQLRLINDIPLIKHIIQRLAKVNGIDQIILATGPEDENKDLADYVKTEGIKTYFDADVDDVTGRIYRAAKAFEADIVVTISGDCPLIDADFLAEGIKSLTGSQADYVYADKERYECIHEGLGWHTLDAWRRLDQLSDTWAYREHAGSAIHEFRHLFNGLEIVPAAEFQRQDIRISVDTQADLDFMNRLYQKSGATGTCLSLGDAVSIVDQNPDILAINQHVHQKGLLEKTKKIAILTYASTRVGMGHLSRMLALARELKEAASARIDFIVNHEESNVARIMSADFQVITWKSKDNPESELRQIFLEKSFDGLVVDLKADDIEHSFSFINQLEIPVTIIDVWPESYSDRKLHIIPSLSCRSNGEYKNTYCGPEYILLDREINNLNNRPLEKSTIVVTAGGSGSVPKHMLNLLSQLKLSWPIHFVVGPYADTHTLENSIEASGLNNYEITQNPNSILELLASSVFAFSIFGITSYELMALGVPQAIYSIVNPADMDIVNHLVAQKACLNSMKGSGSNSLNNIQEILDKPTQLKAMGDQARQIIDGKGSARVAELINKQIQAEVELSK